MGDIYFIIVIFEQFIIANNLIFSRGFMNIGLLIFLLAVVSFLLVRYSPFVSSIETWFANFASSMPRPSGMSGGPTIGSSGNLEKTIRFCLSILISLPILGSCLFVILNGSYTDSTENWAYGAIGTILGYWLKE